MTHFKKYVDSRYISGEDLNDGLNGLKPEMVVTIDHIEGVETFDQKKNETKTSGGIFLKDSDGKQIYKPAILNKTNAKFLAKEFGSPEIEDWYNKPFIMFAQKDSRHGYVVRFRKYQLPLLQAGSDAFKKCHDAIHKNGFTMDQIRKRYQVSSDVEKQLMTNG